jgi:hypothetical protein
MKSLFASFIAALMLQSASAIVILGTGDPSVNTTECTLPGWQQSGWQYMGYFGSFTGVPIAQRWFIASKHIGKQSAHFIFQEREYNVTVITTDPNSDLALYRVNNPFPFWAPIYTRNDEAGKPVMMIGRGTQRGSEVWWSGCPDGPEPRFAGWNFGPSDGVLRWGTNVVTSSAPLISTMFDHDGGFNECQVTPGDSSGGMFVRDTDGLWKLDALIYAMSGGATYVDSFCPSPVPVGSRSYCQQLSYRIGWINQTIARYSTWFMH